MDTLINEQAYFILSKTDLLDAYKIIQSHDAKLKAPLANVLGMDSGTLKNAMVIYLNQISLINFVKLNIF